MKKITIAIATVIALLCVLVLAGCEHEHEWDEWKTAKEPTCTENGIEERSCKCGEKETKEITKLDHIIGDWVIDTEPTCTSDGAKHLSCTVCSEVIVSGPIPAMGHTDGEWITDLEPTCNTDGSEHKTCTVCKETINSRPINALGHDYTENVTKATAESKASVKFDCNVCKESYTEEIEQIRVSAQLTDSGMTMTGGGMYYTRSFEVTATGGYGEYQYKFDGGSWIEDFSPDNTIEIQGNSFVDLAEITVTVKDEAGQQTVYIFKGNGSYGDSYIIYE